MAGACAGGADRAVSELQGRYAGQRIDSIGPNDNQHSPLRADLIIGAIATEDDRVVAPTPDDRLASAPQDEGVITSSAVHGGEPFAAADRFAVIAEGDRRLAVAEVDLSDHGALRAAVDDIVVPEADRPVDQAAVVDLRRRREVAVAGQVIGAEIDVAGDRSGVLEVDAHPQRRFNNRLIRGDGAAVLDQCRDARLQIVAAFDKDPGRRDAAGRDGLQFAGVDDGGRAVLKGGAVYLDAIRDVRGHGQVTGILDRIAARQSDPGRKIPCADSERACILDVVRERRIGPVEGVGIDPSCGAARPAPTRHREVPVVLDASGE